MNLVNGTDGFLFVYPAADGNVHSTVPTNVIKTENMPFTQDISFVIGVTLGRFNARCHSKSSLVYVKTGEEMNLKEEVIDIDEGNSLGLHIGTDTFSFIYKETLKGLSLNDIGLYNMKVVLLSGLTGEEENPTQIAESGCYFYLTTHEE
ncbi:hypothetical protein [Proteus terrae]|uniref:hypothetical protein n=1 Tax=Proteus terrae TaxID=1574161 RepID=UPI00298D3E6D|nr:hypothetical protein [Proteus terrae]WPD00389.1 hypothetical protein R5P25_07730 [Proteus terrae]